MRLALRASAIKWKYEIAPQAHMDPEWAKSLATADAPSDSFAFDPHHETFRFDQLNDKQPGIQFRLVAAIAPPGG